MPRSSRQAPVKGSTPGPPASSRSEPDDNPAPKRILDPLVEGKQPAWPAQPHLHLPLRPQRRLMEGDCQHGLHIAPSLRATCTGAGLVGHQSWWWSWLQSSSGGPAGAAPPNASPKPSRTMYETMYGTMYGLITHPSHLPAFLIPCLACHSPGHSPACPPLGPGPPNSGHSSPANPNWSYARRRSSSLSTSYARLIACSSRGSAAQRGARRQLAHICLGSPAGCAGAALPSCRLRSHEHTSTDTQVPIIPSPAALPASCNPLPQRSSTPGSAPAPG